jgi:hypothetical protein
MSLCNSLAEPAASLTARRQQVDDGEQHGADLLPARGPILRTTLATPMIAGFCALQDREPKGPISAVAGWRPRRVHGAGAGRRPAAPRSIGQALRCGLRPPSDVWSSHHQMINGGRPRRRTAARLADRARVAPARGRPVLFDHAAVADAHGTRSRAGKAEAAVMREQRVVTPDGHVWHVRRRWANRRLPWKRGSQASYELSP